MNLPKIIERAGERVLTTAQLAEAYETSKSTINTNFSRNKKRYVEGKHFFFLVGEDLRAFKKSLTNCKELSQVPQLYLWTERGVLLHAKSLNTDKAWAVYDFLVEHYFRAKTAPPVPQLPREAPTPEQMKQKLTATLLSELRHKQESLALAEAELAVAKASASCKRREVADFIMLHPELMPYANLIEAHE